MNNKTKKILSALLLVAFVCSVVAAVQPTSAQTTYEPKKTYAFVAAIPSPVGVGQETLIHVGITEATASTYEQWKGLTVTVTRPDGTNETLGPFSTDATGGTGTVYIPDEAGIYKLQSHFPEQNMTFSSFFGPSYERTFLESYSPVFELVVQEDPIPYYPNTPLPSEYWNRPINAQFFEWAPLTGNWLPTQGSYSMPPAFKQYEGNGDAPETAHILWTKEYALGGMSGGALGTDGFEMGDAYVGKFDDTVVINGVMYYNQFQSTGGADVEQNVIAVDLKTGEELWTRNWNNNRLSFGQVLSFQGFNYHGVFAYLWSVEGGGGGMFGPSGPTTWRAYDPLSGRLVYTIENVPAANPNFNYYDENGAIIRYIVDQQNGWMAMWNSTRASNPQAAHAVADGSWDMPGQVIDGANGIQWNVSIPEGLPGAVCHAAVDDLVLGSQASSMMGYSGTSMTSWAISTDPENAGTLLWNKTYNIPSELEQASWVWSDVSFEDRVFITSCKEDIRYYGFNLDTGDFMWKTEPEHYLQYYDKYYGPMHAYGLFLSERMSGTTIAYDIQTGEEVWNWNCTDFYSEILWSQNFPTMFHFATDGKIYLSYGEHSPLLEQRGAPMVCLNATTGEEIWRISWFGVWWGGTCVIGDSIMAGLNAGYDGRLYSFGKGATATTLEASPKSSTNGDKIIVEGYVTDIAPGTTEYDVAARFPSGVPAVSDDSMTQHMQYVYMQYPQPTNTTGVEVTISVYDPNNNYYEVATTTSDSDGYYSCSFVPEVAGDYKVLATFEGSKAYWSSHAQTSITVDDLPQPTEAPATETSQVELYFVPAVIGIIVAIVLVGVVTIFVVKRP